MAADRWLPMACDLLVQADEVNNRSFPDPLSEGDRTSASGRQEILTVLAGELADRADDLASIDRQLADAGTPDSRGGPELVQQLRNGVHQLSLRLRRFADRAAKVSTASSRTFESGLTDAVGGLDDGATPLVAAIAVLHQDPAFTTLLAEGTTCRGL